MTTTTRIFVKNVASSTNEDDMAEAFGKFGPIRKIDLKPGYAFIFYEDAKDAEDAIREMNGTELNGKKLLVEVAIDAKSAQREKEGRATKRLDLRVAITGLDARVSWQDLKDWARAAGDVTFANVFVRDGQHVGVVEFFDDRALDSACRTLEDIPLNGVHVRVEKEDPSAGAELRGSGRSFGDSDRGGDRRRYEDRGPPGGGADRGDYRGAPPPYDDRGPPRYDDRDRDRYPPSGGRPYHPGDRYGGPPGYDAPPRYDDRGPPGGYGDRGRYSDDRRGPPPAGGAPYYGGRERSRSRDRGDRGGYYPPPVHEGGPPPYERGPPGGYGRPPPGGYEPPRGGYNDRGPPPMRDDRGPPPPRYGGYEGGRGYDSRGPPR